MRKLKHFHARVLRCFNCQNVSAFAGLFPTEVMAELTGIHEMFLTTRSAPLVVSPVASDSEGNGSDSVPPQIRAAALAIAAAFWVSWDKTWLTSLGLLPSCAFVCPLSWRVSLQPTNLSANNIASWRSWFCAYHRWKGWKMFKNSTVDADSNQSLSSGCSCWWGHYA